MSKMLSGNKNANLKQLTEHVWMIIGPDKARFPSGNSLFIKDGDKNIIIDTNPGKVRILNTIKCILPEGINEITDIFLSHTHLDHGRGLADIFEASNATIHAHPDTLKRCERKARVGMGAGIPKEGIHHFEAFGNSIGFHDREYPEKFKHPVYDGTEIKLQNVTIKTHETFAHLPHMLDYEIIDDNTKIILSCDYDFTQVPWYGVPQRGDSVEMFKQETMNLIKRNPNLIISSHITDPIKPNQFQTKLNEYIELIDSRTERIVKMIGNKEITLEQLCNFVYPVDSMMGRYSNDYVYCAKIWDYWLALAHLEHAWMMNKVECTFGDNDEFLTKCIEKKVYNPRKDDQQKGIYWAEQTLSENPPWGLPLKSMWKRLK